MLVILLWEIKVITHVDMCGVMRQHQHDFMVLHARWRVWQFLRAQLIEKITSHHLPYGLVIKIIWKMRLFFFSIIEYRIQCVTNINDNGLMVTAKLIHLKIMVLVRMPICYNWFLHFACGVIMTMAW